MQDFQAGLKEIDEHAWFQAIGLAIAGDVPAGAPIDDNELFEELQSEMMKRGTLSHAAIRWDWLGEQSSQLLQTAAKDFRLLAYMLHALAARQRVDVELALAAALAARFMILWHKQAFPVGRRQLPPLRQIVDILEAMVAQAQQQRLQQPANAAAIKALQALSTSIAELSPELGIRIATLPGQLQVSEPLATKQAEPVAARAEPPETGAAAGLPLSPPRADSLRLEAGNERALKQSLSVVADFLLGLDVAQPLSYRIRRYATWYGIVAPPPLRSGSRTVIQPVAEDAAESYRIAIERRHDGADIVNRLERSCHLQPFWLEGQMLAFQLARACDRVAVAEAIRSEAQQFFQRVEWLARLQFSDGSQFLPDEVKSWLSARHPAGERRDQGQEAALAQDYFDDGLVVDPLMRMSLNSVKEQARQGRTDLALALLDETRGKLVSARARAIWELLSLECLSDWGMKAMVADQAQRLQATLENQPVQEWEPEFFERLQRLHGRKAR